MALTKCKVCGGAVAEMAAKCPHCGQGHPAVSLGVKFIAMSVVILGFVGVVWWMYSAL